jgi:hypothetical protein
MEIWLDQRLFYISYAIERILFFIMSIEENIVNDGFLNLE